MARRVVAVEDGALRATVVRRVPLRYDAGADAAQDRPGHVRAASAVVWIGSRLAVVQDDANFLALVDPADLAVGVLPLPAGPGGLRQFDDRRGNKPEKLDLEAGLAVELDGGTRVLALGSGSTPARERLAVVDVAGGTAELRPAHALYAALRACTEFSGSELNVEGAALVPGALRLFNRGNGAARDGLRPVDATADLDWPRLRRYLDAPEAHTPPGPGRVVQYDLGRLDGLRLTFTDACRLGRRMLFTAAAEDSPDATRDGRVAGSALGVIGPAGEARYALLRAEDGTLFRGKVEGVAPDRRATGRVWVVIDADDPGVASELCVVELRGGW
jgi:hypothetical protein